MSKIKIIRLDLNTRIQYSLFNFFAPVAFTCILFCSFGLFNFFSTILSFISIIVGLVCLINNLKKYNRYIAINQNSIALCEGKKKPKVLEIIKISDLKGEQIKTDFTIEYQGKKIKLLDTGLSIFGLICFTGPLLIIFCLRMGSVLNNKIAEIKTIYPDLIPAYIDEPNNVATVIMNILMWLCVLFVVGLGCLGILLTPFYGFMK